MKIKNFIAIFILVSIIISIEFFVVSNFHVPSEKMKDKMISDDQFWIALCVYHEARGEPIEAQEAVAKVVLNRMIKDNAPAVDIVFRPYQFSWANGGARPPIKEYHTFLRCLGVAQDALESDNNFHGATHFFDVSIDPPSWASKMHFIAQVGNIRFYRE